MTIVFQGEIEKKNAYAKLLGLVKKGVFFYMYFLKWRFFCDQ